MSLLVAQLGSFFTSVSICKPRASRDSSIEAFVVCKNFQPPPNYCTDLANPLLDFKHTNEFIKPFLGCGDLDWDADRTYELPKDHNLLSVLAPPINPPYKTQIAKQKGI